MLDDFAGKQITILINADGSLGKPLSRELQLDMLEFALHASLDTPLPMQHRSAAYEGPLQAVLRRRYQDMGSRLNDKAAQDFHNGNFGFFVWQATDPTRVTLLFGEKISLNISAEFIAQVSDWRVQQGWKTEVSTLRSDRMDAALSLWPKVKQQFPDSSLASLATDIECPDAADTFPSTDGAVETTPTSPAGSTLDSRAAARGAETPPIAIRAGGRPAVSPVVPESTS